MCERGACRQIALICRPSADTACPMPYRQQSSAAAAADTHTITSPLYHSYHHIVQFKKLAELEHTEAGTIVDVIGVVDNVEPWAVITRKDNTDTRKRALSIRDDSGRSVEVRGCAWVVWER